MQSGTHRITKSCQTRRARRADRLRELLHLSPADSLLLDACARKKVADVKAILSSMPLLNPDTVRDKYLRTPLHIACGRRDDLREATAVARMLIHSGSDVNNGVGDVDGFQPMHMAVLANNFQCVLMLLEEGASVPASDPFRLTPLLLAKLKLDNLRRSSTETSELEYQDLKSITKVLVTHLANKHITTYGPPTSGAYYGLSESLFAKDHESQLNDTISSISNQLSRIHMDESAGSQLLHESMKNLIEKVRDLGIEENPKIDATLDWSSETRSFVAGVERTGHKEHRQNPAVPTSLPTISMTKHSATKGKAKQSSKKENDDLFAAVRKSTTIRSKPASNPTSSTKGSPVKSRPKKSKAKKKSRHKEPAEGSCLFRYLFYMVVLLYIAYYGSRLCQRSPECMQAVHPLSDLYEVHGQPVVAAMQASYESHVQPRLQACLDLAEPHLAKTQKFIQPHLVKLKHTVRPVLEKTREKTITALHSGKEWLKQKYHDDLLPLQHQVLADAQHVWETDLQHRFEAVEPKLRQWWEYVLLEAHQLQQQYDTHVAPHVADLLKSVQSKSQMGKFDKDIHMAKPTASSEEKAEYKPALADEAPLETPTSDQIEKLSALSDHQSETTETVVVSVTEPQGTTASEAIVPTSTQHPDNIVTSAAANSEVTAAAAIKAHSTSLTEDEVADSASEKIVTETVSEEVVEESEVSQKSQEIQIKNEEPLLEKSQKEEFKEEPLLQKTFEKPADEAKEGSDEAHHILLEAEAEPPIAKSTLKLVQQEPVVEGWA
ncbi:hypothetical protein EC973_003992 [Apophysomyces ossiformis]|uniref:Uncharacterized protein n=1 Tax=Apophysomyces ossiformis TaxID=679940 RepID=A0A8H7BX80_9FUNG|nr:hypothetical protein EC973_003992 [Apophysomyces ossiformis]